MKNNINNGCCYRNNIYGAFTFIESVVVLFIIATFITIGYRSLIIYNTTGRDASRTIDMGMIQRTLEYYSLQKGFYPHPEDYFEITHDGGLLWRQGVFGEITREITRRIGSTPIDPLTGNYYIYSTTYDGQEFQLGGIIEGGLFTYTNTTHAIPQTFAQSYQSKIVGNYNRRFITLYEDNNITIFGVPNIISSHKGDKDIQEVYDMGSFVLAGKTYLPTTYYNDIQTNDIYGEWNFRSGNIQTTSAPILYNDTIDNFNTIAGKELFGNNLISYYGDSNIFIDYSDIVSASNPVELVMNYMYRDIGGLNNHLLTAQKIPLSKTDCSNGFILVPGNPLFNTKDFCVSQYHMTYIDADIPNSVEKEGINIYNVVSYEANKSIVSMPGKYPITNITQQEAIDACKSLGSGYHLITNNQWMTIARNIEAYHDSKTIYNGISGDQNLGCDSTGGNNEPRKKGTRTGYGDDEICNNRRMHQLSNGNIIWDFSGNVWSHVNKANNISGIGHNVGHTSIRGSSHPTDWDENGIYNIEDMMLYGSAQGYGVEHGMGSVWYAQGRNNNVLLRGGSAGTQKYAGIFSIFLNFTSDSRSEHVGFRCAR